jgi:membrane protein required for colicin V production
MNFIDILLIVPLAWFAYKGFNKGFIIELAGLIALLLGIYMATHFSHITAEYLRDDLNWKSDYLEVISFTITFLLVVVLVIFFGKTLQRLIKVLQLSMLNKIAGSVFSVLKVGFIISVLIMIITNFQLEDKLLTNEQRAESMLYEPVKSIAPTVFPMIEEQDMNFLDKVGREVDRTIEKLTEE